MIPLETLIIRNLLRNEAYTRKVIPYLKPEYFEGPHRYLFTEVAHFVAKYNALPEQEPLLVEVVNSPRISPGELDDVGNLVNDVFADTPTQANLDWLVDSTEKWCQDAAVRNAIIESVAILDGRDKKRTKEAIPSLMQNALAVGFNTSLGHNYFEDAGARWDDYHTQASKIPFHLNILNDITDGGYERGTLNCILAGIHVGKTLCLSSIAAGALLAGLKVLYITLEDGELKIGKRIDANLVNIASEELKHVDRETFLKKIAKIQAKTDGNLIIRQYPPGETSTAHLDVLLDELRIKKNFEPDVVVIDYLNNMVSGRVSRGAKSYEIVKCVAEDVRAMAIRRKLAAWTGTQLTRAGMESTDPDMTDTSESIGLPQTLDFYVWVGQPESFAEAGQYLWKQLKNRYRNKGYREKFVIGVDKDHQRLFEVEQQAQVGLLTSDGKLTTPETEYSPDYSGFNFGE